MGDETQVTISSGKCPRCRKTDILVIENGLKPICRTCIKTAAEIIEGHDF